MKIGKCLFIVPSLAALFFFTGCLDDDTAPGNGFIDGEVNLFDDATTQVSSQDMSVTLESLPFIGDSTDPSGGYRIEDIPIGNYNLVFEKPGFGTFKLTGVNIFGDGGVTIPELPLGQISTTAITSIVDSIAGEDIFFTIEVSPAGTPQAPRYVRFFLHNLGNVGPENFTSFSNTLTVESNQFVFAVNQAELIDVGFQVGQTVYIRAYGESFYSNEYDDSTLGRRVFPNVNPNAANSIFFQVP